MNCNWFGTRTMADNYGHCFLRVAEYTERLMRVLDYLGRWLA